MTDDAATRFDVHVDASNHFAWIRTILGLQRTLMAAVRTSVSLIGFGFTVAQFFQKLQGKVPEGLEVANPAMPRNVGLTLIAAGVASLIAFTWRYNTAVAYLKRPPFDVIASTQSSMHASVYFVCFIVIAIGVLAFGSVFVRF